MIGLERLKPLMLGGPLRTLAVAESVTCGGIQMRIGRISGASQFFLGGVTAYTIEQKARYLGVDERMARDVNAVSADVAEQMARGVCRMFDADVGLATTGYAEPNPALGVPAPIAFWAVAWKAPDAVDGFVLRSGKVECPGLDREGAQDRIAEAALAALIATLA